MNINNIGRSFEKSFSKKGGERNAHQSSSRDSSPEITTYIKGNITSEKGNNFISGSSSDNFQKSEKQKKQDDWNISPYSSDSDTPEIKDLKQTIRNLKTKGKNSNNKKPTVSSQQSGVQVLIDGDVTTKHGHNFIGSDFRNVQNFNASYTNHNNSSSSPPSPFTRKSAVSTSNGHTLIGSKFGDNVNMSYTSYKKKSRPTQSSKQDSNFKSTSTNLPSGHLMLGNSIGSNANFTSTVKRFVDGKPVAETNQEHPMDYTKFNNIGPNAKGLGKN